MFNKCFGQLTVFEPFLCKCCLLLCSWYSHTYRTVRFEVRSSGCFLYHATWKHTSLNLFLSQMSFLCWKWCPQAGMGLMSSMQMSSSMAALLTLLYWGFLFMSCMVHHFLLSPWHTSSKREDPHHIYSSSLLLEWNWGPNTRKCVPTCASWCRCSSVIIIVFVQREGEQLRTKSTCGAVDIQAVIFHWLYVALFQGEKIKTELAALVRDLPADFDHIAASALELEGAVQYYDDFVHFLLRSVHTLYRCMLLWQLLSRPGLLVPQQATTSSKENKKGVQTIKFYSHRLIETQDNHTLKYLTY